MNACTRGFSRAVLRWAAVLGIGAAPALAHDFWIQPDAFQIASLGSVSMTLQVGHGADRQRSPIPTGRIARFEMVSPRGRKSDLRDGLHVGGDISDADIRFNTPGIHTLLLETDKAAQSRLPAKRFNEYVEAEGLALALAQRTRLHQLDKEGSERYGRIAKSLICVQRCDHGAGNITSPLGLSLEITLAQNPFALPPPSTLPVRVTRNGKPLAGALVKLMQLEHDESPIEMQRTDKRGRASFAMPASGTWLLNVVWTTPLSRGDETDFETVFSSLSFGLISTPP